MRINRFDILFLVFLIGAFFTLGLHIGTERDSCMKEERTVLLLVTSYENIWANNGILLDGTVSANLVSFDGSYAVLSVFGTSEEAGFLVGGRKYIAKNQPIYAVSDSGFLQGRILFIEKA